MSETANLGLATTLELIAELHARAKMNRYENGERWALYTTVGGTPEREPLEVGKDE